MVCGVGEEGLGSGRRLLADDFTVYERAGDDHINKSAFKTRAGNPDRFS